MEKQLEAVKCSQENCKGNIVWDGEQEVLLCNECLTLYARQ